MREVNRELKPKRANERKKRATKARGRQEEISGLNKRRDAIV